MGDTYDADAVFKELDARFEDPDCTVESVQESVDTLKQYVGGFSEELALVKKSRAGFGRVSKENEKLESEVQDLKDRFMKMQGMAAEDAKEVREVAVGLRAPVAKQCERVRLLRAESDPPNPFKLHKSIHEITRDREKEILVATKQLRELKMILKMMKQHEAEIEVESTNQIQEKTSEKDRDIFNLAMKCMKEREQLLEDVKAVKMDIDAIEEHLRTGHYEHKTKKEAKLQDYRAKVQREYKSPGGVSQVFDKPEEKLPEPASKTECSLTKTNATDSTGLHFEDKTRLVMVTPGSAADQAGFASFIGRRVTHCNGNEIRPGYVMKLSGSKSVTLRFDIDTDNLRCSYIKNEDDDPIKTFCDREEKHKSGYKKMSEETKLQKERAREEKKALDLQNKKLKEYEQKMALEKKEKERDIKHLQHKLSMARTKQGEYEAESKKLFAWMTQSQRTLETIRGKGRSRAIGNGAEKRAITSRRKSASPEAVPPAPVEEAAEAEE